MEKNRHGKFPTGISELKIFYKELFVIVKALQVLSNIAWAMLDEIRNIVRECEWSLITRWVDVDAQGKGTHRGVAGSAWLERRRPVDDVVWILFVPPRADSNHKFFPQNLFCDNCISNYNKSLKQKGVLELRALHESENTAEAGHAAQVVLPLIHQYLFG